MKTYAKIIITAAVTASLTFGATSVFYAVNNYGRGGLNSFENKINALNTYISDNYLYDDVDYGKAEDAALKAYVESLGEPYTHYYDSEEFKSYISNVEESYVGIGIVISADTEADKLTVVSATEDSPAEDAGIKPGDYIVEVDGVPFSGSDIDACVSKIKSGKAGTKVEIRVERGGKKMNFTVERKEIVEHSVKYKMIDDEIGYIRITGFNTNSDGSDNSTYTEFEEAIDELESEGMKKLVIDLRDNPGGVLTTVCKIADYILPEGIITYTETRNGVREEYKSDSNEYNIPMVVLINSSSASASEVLTGALKDYGRAEVVGKTSFGKGIVQNVFPFSDGSGVSMTVSKYYTPNGECIHGVGIKPDYDVDLPDEYAESYISEIPSDKDTQLGKAVEILKDK